MKKFSLLALLVLFSFSFSNTTSWEVKTVEYQPIRSMALSLGAALATTLTGTSSITLNVVATTGRGELPQTMTLANIGQDISTVDVIVLDNMAIGDVVILQTSRASEDVHVVDNNSTILLGVADAAARNLDDPADQLWLKKLNSTQIIEVGFYDNK